MLRLQAGTTLAQSIESSARDAVELATRTGCIVEMRFNGVLCVAYPLGDWQMMVREFHAARGPHPVAFAREVTTQEARSL